MSAKKTSAAGSTTQAPAGNSGDQITQADLDKAIEETATRHQKEIDDLKDGFEQTEQELQDTKNQLLLANQLIASLKGENTAHLSLIEDLQAQLEQASSERTNVPELYVSGKVDLDEIARQILSAKSLDEASKVDGVLKLVEKEKSFVVVTVDGQRQEISK